MCNFRRLRRIGKKEQFIMAYGGLRGAVGFSLVVMLRDSQIDPTTVRIFITTTLFIILFTVFIQVRWDGAVTVWVYGGCGCRLSRWVKSRRTSLSGCSYVRAVLSLAGFHRCNAVQ